MLIDTDGRQCCSDFTRAPGLRAEHGIIDLADPSASVEVSDRIEMCVHYSGATVSLHERVYSMRGIRGMRGARVDRVPLVEG